MQISGWKESVKLLDHEETAQDPLGKAPQNFPKYEGIGLRVSQSMQVTMERFQIVWVLHQNQAVIHCYMKQTTYLFELNMANSGVTRVGED